MAGALVQLGETRQEAMAATLAGQLSALSAEEEQLRRELEASTRERIRQLLAAPDREAVIHQTFDRLERQYHDELDGLARRKALLERESSQRAALTKNIESVLAEFDRLLTAGRFSRQDLQLLVERIEVDAEGTVTICLKSSIAELTALLQNQASP